MESVINFSLQSEEPFAVPNSVEAGSGNSLVVVYSIAGAPSTMVLTVMGVIAATGDSIVLDSYSGNTNTVRTINLSQTFDSFEIVGSWTGGLNTAVSGSATLN